MDGVLIIIDQDEFHLCGYCVMSQKNFINETGTSETDRWILMSSLHLLQQGKKRSDQMKDRGKAFDLEIKLFITHYSSKTSSMHVLI